MFFSPHRACAGLVATALALPLLAQAGLGFDLWQQSKQQRRQ